MKKNNIEGWLFVSPLVIWISLIILVPIYIAFELSLFNVKIIGTSGKFVGIDNYIKLKRITITCTSGNKWEDERERERERKKRKK